MGQRRVSILLLIFSLPVSIWGCEKAKNGPTSAAETPTTQPIAQNITVASLVPAATDLLVGMGAAHHLVAISNWDPDRPEIKDLPRVGDYRNVDWEKLAGLKPKVMIVQFSQGKMPAGLSERASELGIQLVNVHNNRLADLFETIKLLGDAAGEPDKATRAAANLRQMLDQIQQSSKTKPPVKVFLGRDATELASVGGGNFLDELLTLAGGVNIIQGGENSYPTIDREKLVSLNPQVVILLLPGVPQHVVAEARRFWSTLTALQAVQDQRVFIWTEDYVLLPGLRVAEIAKRMQDILHPELTKKPTTHPSTQAAAASPPRHSPIPTGAL
ncbi:MAG TPA: helical backbone metal receptor [Tepidisphaeraceae bacterium]|jgi:iron complex transport system substrate-binding protein